MFEYLDGGICSDLGSIHEVSSFVNSRAVVDHPESKSTIPKDLDVESVEIDILASSS